jgi:hypothetical protein
MQPTRPLPSPAAGETAPPTMRPAAAKATGSNAAAFIYDARSRLPQMKSAVGRPTSAVNGNHHAPTTIPRKANHLHASKRTCLREAPTRSACSRDGHLLRLPLALLSVLCGDSLRHHRCAVALLREPPHRFPSLPHSLWQAFPRPRPFKSRTFAPRTPQNTKSKDSKNKNAPGAIAKAVRITNVRRLASHSANTGPYIRRAESPPRPPTRRQ